MGVESARAQHVARGDQQDRDQRDREPPGERGHVHGGTQGAGNAGGLRPEQNLTIDPKRGLVSSAVATLASRRDPSHPPNEGIRMRRASRERIEPLAAKVPEITLIFWLLKVLTTGMGEAMSDFLGQKSIPIGGAIGVFGFAYAMRLQLRQREYRAPVYWFAVVMVAIFGTMVADVLKDGTGVSYAVTTPLFAALTAYVFYRWHRSEGTLSIHSITTRRREQFYWCAVLATFALGTAAGDLTAISLNLGFFASILLFGAGIAVPGEPWGRGRVDP